MTTISGEPINSGSDNYWHVYVYEVVFKDGSRADISEGRMILIDHYFVADHAQIDEDNDVYEYDLPADENKFYDRLIAALVQSFGKEVANFSYQIATSVENGITIDAATYEEL